MALHVYNTLHRKKEEFKPIHEGYVGMYVCGPTVYNHCHIGHAKSYITFDIIVRYIRYSGYKVRYVQNITDVGHLTEDTEEDKILKQSKLENVEPMELVERYTRSYFEDMDALGVLRPDISPRASAHIPEQIALIEKLMETGHAYASKGNVYFSIARFPEYGKLSGRNTEDQMEGARVDVDPDKKDPRDFLLWRKASEDHILKWQSPWGPGYPGWHLECSVMSMRYIGETLDIHGGGMENQFPHHESEIAQSEAANNKPFVKYWIHNNMVTVEGQKMGKSLGNFTTMKDAFQRHDPRVVRFAILRTHYRSPMDYSEDAMHAARSGFDRMKTAYESLKRVKPSGSAKGALSEKAEARKAEFIAAMDDDFNTPKALAAAFDFTGEVNTILAGTDPTSSADIDTAIQFYEELVGEVLGVDLKGREASGESLEAGLVELLIQIRKALRDEKLWAQADQVRDGLAALGVTLEDSKDGTIWKK
ncbi:MAG: cysteine--tRNA ligase [Planctomycetota bacterium]|jgi:cysteinyl-tRNA synthetase